MNAALEMGSLADWAAVVAGAAAAVAAYFAWRTAADAERRARIQRTVEVVREHRTVVKTIWKPLTQRQKWLAHTLDWARLDRTPLMKEILEMLDSGARLAEEFRAGTLDAETLIRLEQHSGERYLYMKDHLFKAMRDQMKIETLYDQFESLLQSCWRRMTEAERKKAEADLPTNIARYEAEVADPQNASVADVMAILASRKAPEAAK